MELLIPGLILVALMVWASTKIKKTAADAFEAESIETEKYSLRKPQGFLHVLGNSDHEFYAYSKEYGEVSKSIRRATITIDILGETNIVEVQNAIKRSAEEFKIVDQSAGERELETEETANETSMRGFYKIVGTNNGIFQLRFAAISEHAEEYLSKAKETLDSFTVQTN